MSLCCGAPEQGMAILVFCGVATAPWGRRTCRRKDTLVYAVLEQAIEHGLGEPASVFDRAYELAIRIE